ncbi:MAG: pilus (MSHA type) biogenesis protein MshL [Gammaproteobacteria bacterium]
MSKHLDLICPKLRSCLVFVFALLLSACQTMSSDEADKGNVLSDDLDTLIQEQQQTQVATPPKEVQQAILPPMPEMSLNSTPEPRFDLAVNKAPAREFFVGLMQGSRWNVVLSPEIQGEISLELKEVSVPLVMDIVRDVYGFEYKITDNIYQVFPAKLKTVIFPVNYLNVKREGTSVIRVNSGEVAQNYASGTTNNQGNAFSNQNRRAGSSGNNENSFGTEIETKTENDFWKELQSSLQMLVSGSPESKVMVSPQTSSVIVRAYPANIREVADYLSAIQDVMGRQVLLEARVLEVILGDSFQSGIDWSSIASSSSSSNLTFTQNGRQVTNPDDTSLLAGVFNISFADSNFDLMIDLLETQGMVQVLSSPRISTLNNQKAVIKVGTDEFFVTDISSTTVANAGSSTTSPDVTLTPFFSGIALDVTPQIDPDGNIVLHIHPSISEVEDQEKLLTLGDEQVTLPLARSTIRESDSIIRAQSGQVVVIGGLMQTQTSDTDSGLPFLKDVEGLGHLFKQKNMRNRKTELVILIRPILVEDDTWNTYLKGARDRMRTMGSGGN